jgi:hypothetical protein
MKRTRCTLSLVFCAILMVGCNGLLGNDSVSLWDASASGASSGSVTNQPGATNASSVADGNGVDACNAPVAGGIGLTDDYQSQIGMGYCYAYSDSSQAGMSTACILPSVLCGRGTSAPRGGSNYGAGIGCNINQIQSESDASTPVAVTTAPAGIGINYSLGSLPEGADRVFLTINDGATEYYCSIFTAAGTCLWPMFYTYPNPAGTGVPLAGLPTALTHVQVQVTSDIDVAEDWEICISGLSFVPAGGSGIGDPCITSDDCLSGTCVLPGNRRATPGTASAGSVGWCTKSCTFASDCNGSHSDSLNAEGTPNLCTSAGDCAPQCKRPLDCYDFFPAVCEPVEGSAPVCVLGRGLGDTCSSDADCIYNASWGGSFSCTASGGAVGWCTAPCTSTSDCDGVYVGNLNAQGRANVCGQTGDAAALSCVPGCTESSDCSPFSGAGCAPVEGGGSACKVGSPGG